MMATLAGCSSLNLRLDDAARKKGAVEARVNLPDWPKECRELFPHAALTKGAEIRVVLKLERRQLDRANTRATRCAELYTRLQKGLR
jgi:hypothetical protein